MNKKIHVRAYSAMNIKFTKKEKFILIGLLAVLVGYGAYQTVYGYTVGSNGTVTIHGPKGSWATFIGQPGSDTNTNFTPDYKVLSIENSTWYMINSTGSLSKIHFGVQDHGMVPYTRLLDGNIHRGLTSFPEVTFNLYFGLCKNRVDTSCNFMKNIESYSDHLVFLDGHHDTIHLVR